MLRLAGAAMLLTASTALGLSASGALTARVRELEQLILLFKTMEWELSGRLTPLPDLLERTSACMSGPVKDFLLLCISALEREDGSAFSGLWEEAAKCVPFHLQESDLLLVNEAGCVLGRYDVHSQCAALAECRRRLGCALEEAKEQKSQMGRVYTTLGIASGLLLVIVLL